jgi:hypothetical protein
MSYGFMNFISLLTCSRKLGHISVSMKKNLNLTNVYCKNKNYLYFNKLTTFLDLKVI